MGSGFEGMTERMNLCQSRSVGTGYPTAGQFQGLAYLPWVLPLAWEGENWVEFTARKFQPKLDAEMIDWKKLKFPDENASANELHTILSDFLREGLDATDAADAEEQKRLQVILKRLELNRRNWSAMATVIQLEIAKDAEELSRLCWNVPLRRSHRRGLDDRRRATRRRK
jgi:hypothetical protein